MADLGTTLSEARIARGLTLEGCERDTRISKRYLDALEREDWNIFPAPVYSRAFLRTYAQYLGLSPDEMMRLFQNQTAEPEFKPLPEIKPAAATGSINYLLAGGVLVFLLVAGFFVYRSSRGEDTAPSLKAQPTATVAPEGQGGGRQDDAPGRAVGEVVKGTVPDLTNVRLEEAITALGTAGLDYVIVETSAAGGQTGIVQSQDPAPGTKAGGDTSVTLVVPRG